MQGSKLERASLDILVDRVVMEHSGEGFGVVGVDGFAKGLIELVGVVILVVNDDLAELHVIISGE